MKRKYDTKYTYYRIDFEDSPEDFDYTIVETLEQALPYLELMDIHFDDPERNTTVTISGIGMTPRQYNKWIKENQP